MQRDYARHAGLGFEFAATVGLLAWLGWLLDGAVGIQESFPAFLLLGTFLGLGLAIYRLMIRINQETREAKREAERRKAEEEEERP